MREVRFVDLLVGRLRAELLADCPAGGVRGELMVDVLVGRLRAELIKD